MKKLITLGLCAIMFLLLPAVAFANTIVIPPFFEGVDVKEYFISLGAIAALVLPITALLTKWFKVSNSTAKQLLSWFVALLLSFVGWYFQWGVFVGATWHYIFVYGACTGLIANGIFDMSLVQTILKLLKLQQKTTN